MVWNTHLKQEGKEFKAVLGYTGKFEANLGYLRPCLKQNNTKKKTGQRVEGCQDDVVGKDACCQAWRP